MLTKILGLGIIKSCFSITAAAAGGFGIMNMFYSSAFLPKSFNIKPCANKER